MLTKKFLEKLEQIVERGAPASYSTVGRDPHAVERVFVSLPAHRTNQDVTDALLGMETQPRAISGTVQLTALDSFINFADRMRLANSVLFANRATPGITAIFDYHGAVNAPMEESPEDGKERPRFYQEDSPQWGRFRASFAFPLSRPWIVWSKRHKQPMGQEDLAEFLEENVTDVIDALDPTSDVRLGNLVSDLGLSLGSRQDLLRTARGLALHSNEKINQIVNTTTGETQVVYEQAHANLGADVRVPSAFLIGVPVFEGDAYYRLLVRLRHRKIEQSVRWSYDIYAMERAVDDAFVTACGKASDATSLPLFYGDAPTPQHPV